MATPFPDTCDPCIRARTGTDSCLSRGVIRLAGVEGIGCWGTRTPSRSSVIGRFLPWGVPGDGRPRGFTSRFLVWDRRQFGKVDRWHFAALREHLAQRFRLRRVGCRDHAGDAKRRVLGEDLASVRDQTWAVLLEQALSIAS